LALLMLVHGAAIAAAPAAGKVLVIYSLGPDASSQWQTQMNSGMRAELASHPYDAQPQIFEERLDGVRIDVRQAADSMAAYLPAKYAGLKFDLIVSENFFAGRFLSEHPQLFPGVPRIYMNHGRHGWKPDDGLALEVTPDYVRSLDVIPRMMPGVKRIVVVADSSARGREWTAGLRAAAPLLPGHVTVEMWDRLGFDELYRRAAALRQGTAIYMLATYADGNGVPSPPLEVAHKLLAVSPVPVFTHVESLIVPGLVGGYVMSGERVGHLIARLLLGLPIDMHTAQTYVVDYNAVRRFGLATLDEDVLWLNRPLGLWELYRWQIVSGASLILLQALLISALLMALRSRRRTLAQLNNERNKLEERVVHRTLELLVANNELEKLTVTDPLTGIGNRRKMTEQIGAELERARRFRHSLALLMVDIDHFKRINDTHGHEAGDRTIVAVSAALTAHLRSIDMAARFGGEEFVMLMPESAMDEAVRAAERLRAAVEALRLDVGTGQTIALTISIGVAVADPDDGHDGTSALLMRADKALYRAKKEGRNRVVGS
jgi:diguanylate cyclase (GGDEF)-like protein